MSANVDRFLRIVLAISEERQITRAAERLGTAQPWVSRQLREAEGEVGVKLFKRVHGGVEATPSGEAFIKEARQAVFHIDLSVSRARAAGASVTDRLVIGISPFFDPLVNERIHDCLHSVLPNIKLIFDSRFVSEQIDGILRTDLHLGLAELPIRQERVMVLLLKRESMLLAGGRGEPLLAASSLHTENLNRKPCMLLASRENPSQRRIAGFLSQRGMRSDNIREVLTLPEALQHVESGKAYAILPPLAARLNYGGVVFRPLKGLQIGYGLLYHEDHRSSTIRTALTALKQCFSSERGEIQSTRRERRRKHATAS